MSKINGDPDKTFDYIIVGAGAAGSILANRLSEDGKTTVCVLEAGPRDWHPFLHIPAGFIKVLFDPAFTWQFSSEPTDNTKGRRVPSRKGARSAVRPPSTAWPTTVVSLGTLTPGRPLETRDGAMPTCCPTSSAPSERSAGATTPTMDGRANKPSRTWTGSTPSVKPSSPGLPGKGSPATRTTTEPPKRVSATTSAPFKRAGGRARRGLFFVQLKGGRTSRFEPKPTPLRSCLRVSERQASNMWPAASGMRQRWSEPDGRSSSAVGQSTRRSCCRFRGSDPAHFSDRSMFPSFMDFRASARPARPFLGSNGR